MIYFWILCFWLGCGTGTAITLRVKCCKMNALCYIFVIVMGFLSLLAMANTRISNLLDDLADAIVETKF